MQDSEKEWFAFFERSKTRFTLEAITAKARERARETAKHAAIFQENSYYYKELGDRAPGYKILEANAIYAFLVYVCLLELGERRKG